MINLQNFVFFNEATTTGDSQNTLSNPNNGSQLILQVTGTATSFELVIKGCVDFEKNEYSELCAINEKSFATNYKITAQGIYIIPADGIMKLKATINSVSGGNLNVFGRLGE